MLSVSPGLIRGEISFWTLDGQPQTILRAPYVAYIKSPDVVNLFDIGAFLRAVHYVCQPHHTREEDSDCFLKL